MAQLEREASLDSSEATSITNSSTQEGELTIQHDKSINKGDEEDDDAERTLATTPEMEEVTSNSTPAADDCEMEGIRRLAKDPNKKVLTDFSSDDIMLLKKKLEEVRDRKMHFK